MTAKRGAAAVPRYMLRCERQGAWRDSEMATGDDRRSGHRGPLARALRSLLDRTTGGAPMTASRAAPPARHLPGWLLVVAALLLLLASAVGIEVLDARLAESLHAAHTLTQVRAQTNLLSAINWETVAQHARPAGDGAEERAATGQLTAALAALVPLEQDIPAIGRVRTLARAYAGDVDHLQDLYLARSEEHTSELQSHS